MKVARCRDLTNTSSRREWQEQKIISPQRNDGEDARAAVLDQQMRPESPQYPVDRYLVESNKKVEMVNIIDDDDIWNSEPALRPEDEIILKKLHDMLQSTADDLKLLSGELAKINQPGVQIKSQPAPLDEEFNEKVHIEEIVNAKFHGYRIIDKTLPFSAEFKPKQKLINELLDSKSQKPKAVNTSVQVNSLGKAISHKDLKITILKAVHINENNEVKSKEKQLMNKNSTICAPTISYDEVIHNYVEKKKGPDKHQLRIQNIPSINIRSELKEQRVLNLDILPECTENTDINRNNINVGFIEVLFESPEIYPGAKKTTISEISKNYQNQIFSNRENKPKRKISKMSTYESSESTNNLSTDAQNNLNIQKQSKNVGKSSLRLTERSDMKNKKHVMTRKTDKRKHSSLDEWKIKLNSIYGQPSSSRSKKMSSQTRKVSPRKSNISKHTPKSNTLNNREYIPYNELTLGGVRVSDIEREIDNIANKNDLQLSPILDKILSSKENSFHKDSHKKDTHKETLQVLNTSDENLLQEVIDIEKTISDTLSKELKDNSRNIKSHLQDHKSLDDGSNDSYADDFEDEKSEPLELPQVLHEQDSAKDNFDVSSESEQINDNQELTEKLKNTTYTKVSNLSFKDSVDVFEFVHSIDTQETGTQSNTANRITPKETQTSPTHEKTHIQPIRNDLWPSVDPKGEIESLFQLEKEFIKKLIIDEYGEIIESNIMKPSSSKERELEDKKKNIVAFQKNTQTSPAHVKCSMTSPTKTKTRTTSPFTLSFTADRQTSPMLATNVKIVVDNEPDDIGISINLSSPRFSLRLPQNSREVLSNLDNYSHIQTEQDLRINKSNGYEMSRKQETSSSSINADHSSSEIYSLGEVQLKPKRRMRKSRIKSISKSSSSSAVSRHSSDVLSEEILPLRSEGEVSLGLAHKKPPSRCKESDGEMNLN